MLFDGPELRGPELGAMRRRGVRRHAQMGHEPRDGHELVVRHVQCGVLVRGRRLGLDLIQRKHHRVGYLQGHGHGFHVPRRRLVQPTHRLMGYLASHVHEPHVLLRRRVQSANRLVGYLQGHVHGFHVPRFSISTQGHGHEWHVLYAASFNQSIGSWDTSQVTYMGNLMFLTPPRSTSIGSWDTSKVTDMGSMFFGAAAFNQPIGSWDTSQVTRMRSMFQDAAAFNQPIGSWDTSKVTDTGGMGAPPVHSMTTALTPRRASYTIGKPPMVHPPRGLGYDLRPTAPRDTLASGSSCQPAWTRVVSGTSSCLNRVLTSATCSPTRAMHLCRRQTAPSATAPALWRVARRAPPAAKCDALSGIRSCSAGSDTAACTGNSSSPANPSSPAPPRSPSPPSSPPPSPVPPSSPPPPPPPPPKLVLDDDDAAHAPRDLLGALLLACV